VGGAVVQAASKVAREISPAMPRTGTLGRVENIRDRYMWILVLEAGAALLLLIFIVWWTMFSGRK
jgi:hypothetical protein